MGMMGGMTPQMLQALLAQQMSKQGGGGPQMQPPAMPQVQPGQPGAMQPPAPQQGNTQQPQFQSGGSTMMLPGGTASPAITGIPMSATPPGEKPRLTGTGIMGSVLAIKNNFQDKRVQKARTLASQQIAMLQNPEMKKSMDDAAKKDPNVAKALEKQQKDWIKIYDKAMTDPNSAEYQGVQMAYRDQIQQEQQDVSMREMQAKMEEQRSRVQQQQALSQQEQARAGLLQRQTQLAGTETEADKAKLDARMEQVTAQIKARMLQSQAQVKAMLEATKIRATSAVQSAAIRAGGTVKAAQARQNKADQYIINEYKALNQQLNELDKQSKDLQSHLDKTTHWYADPEDKADVQQQLSQIEAQRGVLMQQFQMLQQKDQAFQRSSITTPMQPVGTGTQDKPIVIP